MSQQNSIPSLWPAGIRLDVLTPEAILNRQVAALEELTKGTLTAEIEKGTTADGAPMLWFTVKAPAIRYTVRIFVVKSLNKQLPFPVEVSGGGAATKQCSTDQDFTAAVASILQSAPTKSTVLAMIAKSNEAQPPSP